MKEIKYFETVYEIIMRLVSSRYFNLKHEGVEIWFGVK